MDWFWNNLVPMILRWATQGHHGRLVLSFHAVSSLQRAMIINHVSDIKMFVFFVQGQYNLWGCIRKIQAAAGNMSNFLPWSKHGMVKTRKLRLFDHTSSFVAYGSWKEQGNGKAIGQLGQLKQDRWWRIVASHLLYTNDLASTRKE